MKRILPYSLLTALLLLAGSAAAQEVAPAKPNPNKTPVRANEVTVITSDRLLFDYKNQYAIFEDNVVVIDPGLKLTCEKLTVRFDEEGDVERIEAKTNVFIQQEDKTAKAGMAIYEVKKGLITLTEKPQITRGKSVLQAEKIMFWRFENRLEAYPHARLLVFQADRKENL